MTKKILLVTFLVILAGLGAYILLSTNDKGQISPAGTFVNSAGGYGFNYPVGWQVFASAYNPQNSLFGPSASTTTGLGGVEVFSGQTSVEAFMKGVAAEYSAEIPVTVDGVTGLRAHYRGASSGEQVILLKNGTVYNLYLGSERADDLKAFEDIVSSFKFK